MPSCMLFAWLGTIILLCCESQSRVDESISKSSYYQHIPSASSLAQQTLRLDLQRYDEGRAGAVLVQSSGRRSLHQHALHSEDVPKTVNSDFTHQAVLTSYLTNKELVSMLPCLLTCVFMLASNKVRASCSRQLSLCLATKHGIT